MRQSKGNLKRSIFKMSKGESVLLGDFDQRTLCFEPTNTFDRETLSEIVRRYSFDISTSRFVTPQHKHAEGTVAMNRLLQEIFLPENSTPLYPSFKVTGNTIHVNDLVVRIKNDYSPESNQAMHVNGDVGYVRPKNNTLGVYLVEYENGSVETVYLDDLYKEFTLAYCLTVHKVQGSQYLDVVVLMGNNHEFSWGENNPDARSLLYTAMSRAKRRCIVIGNPGLFKMAQRSSRSHAPKRSLFMKEFKDYEI
jgi:exodeoxyribonuclease V alpha subunit